MKKTSIILSGVFLFSSIVFFGFQALAQEEMITENLEAALDESNIKNAEGIASVNLYNTEVVSQDNNKIKLSFDLSNNGEMQLGVKYAVQLIRSSKNNSKDNNQELAMFGVAPGAVNEFAPMNQVVLDEKIYPEKIDLKKNQIFHKELEYTAPAYLNGEFEVWVIAKNSNNLLLSLDSPSSVNLKGDNQFIEIVPESCYLQIQNDESKTKYNTEQGVDISLEENLGVTCKLVNNYKEKIDFVPNFDIYRRSVFGELVAKGKDVKESFTIEPKQEKEFTFVIPKNNTPQAYDAKLTLKKDNKEISNSIISHYVIQGESATIQNFSLDKDSYQSGDKAIASLYVTPSADLFYGSRSTVEKENDVVAEISISNDKGKSCLKKTYSEKFSQGNDVKKFSLSINRDCQNPQVIVVLKSNEGKVLDQKTYQINSENISQSQVQGNTNNIKLIALALLVIILLMIILFLVNKKKKGGKLLSIMFLVGFGMTLFFTSYNEAQAGTFTVPGISGGNSYMYIWPMNNCQAMLRDPCNWDRRWPLGPTRVSNCSAVRAMVNNGTYRLRCYGNTMYVSTPYPYTPYPWVYAGPASYTVNLNKATYTPGESIRITANARASYCGNGIYNAYLVVNNKNNWTRIISNPNGTGRYAYGTAYTTASTTPGRHSLTFYGSAYKGHDSAGNFRTHTMYYNVASPVSYSWVTGYWGSCSAICGGGTQTRDVYCQRDDGVRVADSYCSGSAPTDSQLCNTQACPINGECGPANRVYECNETEFNGPFCMRGSLDVRPNFPTRDGSVTWRCLGESGGSSMSCVASREKCAGTNWLE